MARKARKQAKRKARRSRAAVKPIDIPRKPAAGLVKSSNHHSLDIQRAFRLHMFALALAFVFTIMMMLM